MKKKQYQQPSVDMSFFNERNVLTVSGDEDRAIGWNSEWDSTNGAYWG